MVGLPVPDVTDNIYEVVVAEQFTETDSAAFIVTLQVLPVQAPL